MSDMGPQFFSVTPRPGKAISLEGLAEGLARMEHALRTLSVKGGRVEWSNYEPKIILNDEVQSP